MIKSTRAAKWLGRVSALRFGLMQGGGHARQPEMTSVAKALSCREGSREGRSSLKKLKSHPLRLQKVVD